MYMNQLSGPLPSDFGRMTNMIGWCFTATCSLGRSAVTWEK
jgi:hypothetical protein